MSPYTALAVPPDPGGAEPLTGLALGPSWTPCGDWNRVELRNAISRVKDQYPKAREAATHLRVTLDTDGAELHAVYPAEAKTLCVNPRFLLDGLGPWPAVLYYGDGYQPLCVATERTRYYVASILFQ